LAVRWFGPIAILFDAWCIATPAALWILAQVLFREGFRAGPLHWTLAGALTLTTLAADLGRFRLGLLGNEPAIAQALLLAGRGAALLLVLAAGWTALAQWRVDLVETRRRARVIFVAIIFAVFATLVSSDFIFGPAGATAGWLALGHSVLVAITFALLQAIAAGSVDELLTAAAAPQLVAVAPESIGVAVIRAPASRSRAITAALANRVTAEIEARKLWQREGLGNRRARRRARYAGIPVAPRDQSAPRLSQLQRFPARVPAARGRAAAGVPRRRCVAGSHDRAGLRLRVDRARSIARSRRASASRRLNIAISGRTSAHKRRARKPTRRGRSLSGASSRAGAAESRQDAAFLKSAALRADSA
jgi:hypothetical protein